MDENIALFDLLLKDFVEIGKSIGSCGALGI